MFRKRVNQKNILILGTIESMEKTYKLLLFYIRKYRENRLTFESAKTALELIIGEKLPFDPSFQTNFTKVLKDNEDYTLTKRDNGRKIFPGIYV